MTEKLKWNDAAVELPDDARTMLLWVRDTKPFANPWWTTGYHLHEGGWHDSYTGDALTELVTHWAEPSGPGT